MNKSGSAIIVRANTLFLFLEAHAPLSIEDVSNRPPPVGWGMYPVLRLDR
jgi:hypothetical protein